MKFAFVIITLMISSFTWATKEQGPTDDDSSVDEGGDSDEEPYVFRFNDAF